MKPVFLVIIFLLLNARIGYSQHSADPLIKKGWAALTRDEEITAFHLFHEAYQQAEKSNDTYGKAEASLYLGISTYGSSPDRGMKYAARALYYYDKSGNTESAARGRARCLQLISTIYIRQGKNAIALKMSREVVSILKDKRDSTGTLGLDYSAIGDLYDKSGRIDSVAYFYRLAAEEFERANIVAYLPSAFLKRGKIEEKRLNYKEAFGNYYRALNISEKSGNRQAMVLSLLAVGESIERSGDRDRALEKYLEAKKIASQLSDKTFEIKVLERLVAFAAIREDFHEQSRLQRELLQLKDSVYTFEKAEIVKNLEVRFEVGEKDRELALVKKQKELTRVTNTFLVLGIVVLLLISIIVFFFMRRIQRKDRALLKMKAELVLALEEKEIIREEQFKADLAYKESQLSALTLQMLQKNELLESIRELIAGKENISGHELGNLVTKSASSEAFWKDFNNYFESINTHFYAGLRKKFPEISANDLKICALIRLNMSVKEMASVLAISPDSVKTARYRLRKKLQLTTENNLNTFILEL